MKYTKITLTFWTPEPEAKTMKALGIEHDPEEPYDGATLLEGVYDAYMNDRYRDITLQLQVTEREREEVPLAAREALRAMR